MWARLFGKALTWADLPWLRSLTKLPLILKGICHPDDARRAIDGGVDAIYCSNHGGRQANGGIAAIDMLPGVVAAAGKTPGAVRFRHPIGHATSSRRWRSARPRSASAAPMPTASRSTAPTASAHVLQMPARRGRPADGGQRLSDARRSRSFGAHADITKRASRARNPMPHWRCGSLTKSTSVAI